MNILCLNGIPAKIILQISEIFMDFLCNSLYSCLESGIFPDELELAEVVPVYKKNDKKEKSNYRPIIILSNISKIYERYIQTQLNEYFAKIRSKFTCGVLQKFSTPHYLLVMIEKPRKIRDEKGFLLLSSLTCHMPSTAPYTNYRKTKCFWF